MDAQSSHEAFFTPKKARRGFCCLSFCSCRKRLRPRPQTARPTPHYHHHHHQDNRERRKPAERAVQPAAFSCAATPRPWPPLLRFALSMDSSALSPLLSTVEPTTTGSVPPSVASSSEESSNDSMNGSPPPTTLFASCNGGTSTSSNHQDDNSLLNVELPWNLARPSRESVLQRLSESLLRRSLTKVCLTVLVVV